MKRLILSASICFVAIPAVAQGNMFAPVDNQRIYNENMRQFEQDQLNQRMLRDQDSMRQRVYQLENQPRLNPDPFR